MLPTLPVKGIMLVERAPYEDLKVNDIVCFYDWEYHMHFTFENGDTCHRLVYFDSVHGWWIARGDNNSHCDRVPVTRDNYRSRYVRMVRVDKER